MELTREQKQQVTNALALLAPAPAFHDQCKSDIEAALINTVADGVDPKPYSKNTKEVVKPLLAALKKARDLHNRLVPLDDYGIVSTLDLENLNQQIAFYQDWMDERPDSSHRRSPKQQAAVAEAHALVLQYCKRKQDHSATRGNKWWKLSAILLGKKVDLFRHMRTFKSRPDPVQR